ncbi:MAG TPA: DUF4190 domain-containing protein [Tepidisphaeraceae bacterium]
MNAPDRTHGPTNPWATISVLCGIVGCLILPPILAVILGGVGLVWARRTGVGRRAARLGVSLGVAWLALFALGGAGGVWVSRHGAMWVAERQSGELIDVINRLPQGGLDRRPSPHRIGDGRARELADVVRPLGACRRVTVRHADFTNRDGVFGVVLDADADFDHGQWPLRARLYWTGIGWGFNELDWQ